ncbi:hypothetical protein T484DRAFT_1776211, partial [Baffinella frigidus]
AHGLALVRTTFQWLHALPSGLSSRDLAHLLLPPRPDPYPDEASALRGGEASEVGGGRALERLLDDLAPLLTCGVSASAEGEELLTLPDALRAAVRERYGDSAPSAPLALPGERAVAAQARLEFETDAGAIERLLVICAPLPPGPGAQRAKAWLEAERQVEEACRSDFSALPRLLANCGGLRGSEAMRRAEVALRVAKARHLLSLDAQLSGVEDYTLLSALVEQLEGFHGSERVEEARGEVESVALLESSTCLQETTVLLARCSHLEGSSVVEHRREVSHPPP